jgi:hypothetical protein
MAHRKALVFAGGIVPILDVALSALEEFKYGWWQDGKQHMSAWLENDNSFT